MGQIFLSALEHVRFRQVLLCKSYQQYISHLKRAIRLISFLGIKLIPRIFSKYEAYASPLFINQVYQEYVTSSQFFRQQFLHDQLEKQLPTAFENMFQLDSFKHDNFLDSLANEGLIRFVIKVQSIITVQLILAYTFLSKFILK